jgi:hypothetical protein
MAQSVLDRRGGLDARMTGTREAIRTSAEIVTPGSTTWREALRWSTIEERRERARWGVGQRGTVERREQQMWKEFTAEGSGRESLMGGLGTLMTVTLELGGRGGGRGTRGELGRITTVGGIVSSIRGGMFFCSGRLLQWSTAVIFCRSLVSDTG